jgi:flagellar hook-length control protein FliK
MPAISAAANPVAAIASASGTSKSASGADTAERSFSTVLAEQSGRPPKAVGSSQASNEAPKTKSESAAKDDSADEPASATQPTDGQITAPAVGPGDSQAAKAGDAEAETLDMQIQAITELMQTMQPVAVNPAPPESQPVPIAAPASTLAATAIPETSGHNVGSDFLAEPATETQPVASLLVQDRPAPNTPQVTAKVAGATDTATLSLDARNLPSGEQTAAKLEIALDNAAAVALPAHISTTTPTSHGSEYRIVTPVGSKQWESAIGNSLVVMTGSGRDRAELVLTPPQLGRVEVSITMKGDEASAVFVSANPGVREALENALPRLREVLADAGITLGQTQIGSESPGQSAADRQTGDNARRSAIGENRSMGDASGVAPPSRVISRSLVDTYA